MTVKVILSDKGRSVVTQHPDATLAEICETLATHKIGAVVLTTRDGDIAGILSERDVVRALAQEGAGALSQKAAGYMSRNVVTCHEEETTHDVMTKMTAGRFRHMPVVKAGRLIGVVSIGDVVKRRIEQVEKDAEEIRNYIATA
ncbi:CBS domain-containing protein [Prosthecomicrobium hirschii]|jgi:CBS domain-containing protein|uniref:Inosine-5-monophosphate dehydrogenase n=1 Tax=Prosthecodimorpha hirschii TaxID=665126 RepID=A0A0P6VHP5_9HYPH|nr:CBS domain-containing protein [Prosthecomicrobium hirschii]KPL51591.1 inosine-5-monophosphate dehydrogenase [Prosthecomicrobium hirschii]MCW1838483.1 CBS domain-containing protein [Prosthecomicrobium hirschii]